MTRSRAYGEDSPFTRWVRDNPDLPSYDWENGFGLGLTDTDLVFHRYLCKSLTGQNREIQAIMCIEVKTRGGDLSRSQRDTLFKQHSFLFDVAKQRVSTKKIDGSTVFHFGFSVLQFSGTYPEDSDFIRWGRFQSDGSLLYKDLDLKTLTAILRFELHPTNLKDRPFRLHHKERVVTERHEEPLGFYIDRRVVYRS